MCHPFVIDRPGEIRSERARKTGIVGVLALSMILAGAGCVRQAGKAAAEGAIDMVAEKVNENKKERQARGEPTLGEEAGAVVSPVTRDVVEGSISALEQNQKPIQQITQSTVEAAAAGAVLGAFGQREDLAALMGEQAGAAGRAFTQEAIGALLAQMEAQAGQQDGEIGEAGARVARRAASAAMAGVADQMTAEMAPCSSDDPRCVHGALQRASHAVSAGLASGIGDQIRFMSVLAAFVVGAALAALAAWIIGHVKRGREVVRVVPVEARSGGRSGYRGSRHSPQHLRLLGRRPVTAHPVRRAGRQPAR